MTQDDRRDEWKASSGTRMVFALTEGKDVPIAHWVGEVEVDAADRPVLDEHGRVRVWWPLEVDESWRWAGQVDPEGKPVGPAELVMGGRQGPGMGVMLPPSIHELTEWVEVYPLRWFSVGARREAAYRARVAIETRNALIRASGLTIARELPLRRREDA